MIWRRTHLWNIAGRYKAGATLLCWAKGWTSQAYQHFSYILRYPWPPGAPDLLVLPLARCRTNNSKLADLKSYDAQAHPVLNRHRVRFMGYLFGRCVIFCCCSLHTRACCVLRLQGARVVYSPYTFPGSVCRCVCSFSCVYTGVHVCMSHEHVCIISRYDGFARRLEGPRRALSGANINGIINRQYYVECAWRYFMLQYTPTQQGAGDICIIHWHILHGQLDRGIVNLQ